MVERFFAEITRKQHPARRLQKRRRVGAAQAIYDYLAIDNHNPVPFVWTATATAILEKIRARQANTRNRQGGNQVLESGH